jgi:hypothetical protein
LYAIHCHGFLRASNGTFTTFDVPGAVDAVFPFSISTTGAITGKSCDAITCHGFLRGSNGTITTFDAPGAGTGTGFFQGTNPLGITPGGAIAGVYYDVNSVGQGFLNGVGHGFLRASDGTFTTFDPPGFIDKFADLSFGPDFSINPDGMITGTYFQLIPGNLFGGNFRVFVRAPGGTFTTFDAATSRFCCIWSFPSGINPAGAITGSFNDSSPRNHGFLRASDGTITTFDVPAAGTGFSQGTIPWAINPGGVIMGFCIDANNVRHGFVFKPQPSDLSVSR